MRIFASSGLLLLTTLAALLAACSGGQPFLSSSSEEPTPRSASSAAATQEADAVADLPGEYVDLPHIYNGYYGNREGANTAAHVSQPIDYSVQGLPPAGGPHWGRGACPQDPDIATLYCGPVPWGIYRKPWDAESLVHNLEHAGVVIWYNTTDRELISQLEDFAAEQLNGGRLLVLTPYPDMAPETVAITVWSRRDAFAAGEYDQGRLEGFIDALYCRFDPEGLCSTSR